MELAFSSTSSWLRSRSIFLAGAFPPLLPGAAAVGCFFGCAFFCPGALVFGRLTGLGAVLPALGLESASPLASLAGAVIGRSDLGTLATITAFSQHSFIC